MPSLTGRVNQSISLITCGPLSLVLVATLALIISGCGPDEETRQGTLGTGALSDAEEPADIPQDSTPNQDVGEDKKWPIQRVLNHLNPLRETGEMSELRESALLTLAAQNHADYLLAHPESFAPGQDPHLQSPDSPLFTGLKVQQRVEAVGYEGKSLGENIARRATAESALQSWLETLYSRLPLMDPALEEIGIGEAGSIHERVYVLVAGTTADEASVDLSIRTYPPSGADEIMADWNGNELPQPKPPPDGYPSGPVISLHTGDTPFDGMSGILRNSDGQTVPCTAFSLANDPNLPAGVAAIIPHQPLTPDSLYFVSWNGSISGTAFDTDHSFRTAPSSCRPTMHDCGHGRACYIQQGEDTCLWVGPLGEGDTCLYINDCAQGMGCYGLNNTQLCRRYCPVEGTKNCDTICSGQYSVLDDDANTGFCWNMSKE